MNSGQNFNLQITWKNIPTHVENSRLCSVLKIGWNVQQLTPPNISLSSLTPPRISLSSHLLFIRKNNHQCTGNSTKSTSTTKALMNPKVFPEKFERKADPESDYMFHYFLLFYAPIFSQFLKWTVWKRSLPVIGQEGILSSAFCQNFFVLVL